MQEEKELDKLCALLRSVTATTITKLKAERPTPVDHVNALMEYTHQQV
ncbi:unnamed protein product [Gongylonema pulchrum]|uniref:Transcriptional regulator n=1 Tax=Gongylonema pulchrum TaxID=637853 RepID=A0A183DIX2_9BILA|nr:unnamed protein product [Gongylonema pulchrum]